MCNYFKSLGFPSKVTVGLRVGRLESSSVRYEIGLLQDEANDASAQGHFVHVCVDRASGWPVPLPGGLRDAVSRLLF